VYERAARLRALGYASYSDYLRSPHWREVKARYRASDLPQACMCGADDVQLHHTTYDRIDAEDLSDLLPLCASCHTLIHVLEARGEVALDFAGFESAERAHDYANDAPAQDRLARAIIESPEMQQRVAKLLWKMKRRGPKYRAAVLAKARARLDQRLVRREGLLSGSSPGARRA
jgi:hypothetical protein